MKEHRGQESVLWGLQTCVPSELYDTRKRELSEIHICLVFPRLAGVLPTLQIPLPLCFSLPYL